MTKVTSEEPARREQSAEPPYMASTANTAQRLFGRNKRSDRNRVVKLCNAGQLRHLKDGPNYWIPTDAIPEMNEVILPLVKPMKTESIEKTPPLIEAVPEIIEVVDEAHR